jgi:hypothetical protein
MGKGVSSSVMKSLEKQGFLIPARFWFKYADDRTFWDLKKIPIWIKIHIQVKWSVYSGFHTCGIQLNLCWLNFSTSIMYLLLTGKAIFNYRLSAILPMAISCWLSKLLVKTAPEQGAGSRISSICTKKSNTQFKFSTAYLICSFDILAAVKRTVIPHHATFLGWSRQWGWRR